MELVGRTFNSDSAVYGFNGKRKDNAINGDGVDYDYGARIYDSRLGRFLSVDPLTKKYPSEAPYSAMDNSPLSIIDPDGKGGIVTLDKQNCIVTISSTFTFYGNGASSDKATKIAAKIETQWNAANGTTVIDGVTYSVRFKVTGTYMDVSDPATAKLLQQQIKDNNNVSHNFYRIGNDVPAGFSASDPPKNSPVFPGGPSGNTGEFSTKDVDDAHGTTESHEYGHGLGLTHDDPDNTGVEIGQGQPGIMVARGTMVSGPYTRNPSQGDSKEVIGKNGGISVSNAVDPDKRKVTQEDIDNLCLGSLKYDTNGQATLGVQTNTYHEDPSTPK